MFSGVSVSVLDPSFLNGLTDLFPACRKHPVTTPGYGAKNCSRRTAVPQAFRLDRAALLNWFLLCLENMEIF